MFFLNVFFKKKLDLGFCKVIFYIIYLIFLQIRVTFKETYLNNFFHPVLFFENEKCTTMIKKIGKTIWRTFLGILAFFALYFLFTFLLTIIPSNRNFKPAENGVDLYIISNGVHTDICFEIANAELDWKTVLNVSNFKTESDKMKYLSFGWGDKGFYFDTPTWADLSAKTAATAAFIPSATAMHVSVLKNKPRTGEMIRKTKVSKAQLLKMEEYILNTLQTENGKALLIDCCRYEGFDDNFYEANGSYHMLRTCNTWANQTLQKGEIKTAIWAPFDKCILHHFENKYNYD